MSTAHVLVVDDEADIRALIQEILTDEGYEVTTAANAAEARSAKDESKPELVLLDIWMPDTDESRCCANGPRPASWIARSSSCPGTAR